MSCLMELRDAAGCGVTVNTYEGCYFHRGALPVPFGEHMRRVREMDIHKEDILICSYPKSGPHRLWEIVSTIVHGDRNRKISEADMLDFTSIKLLDRTQPPRILGSHFRFRFLPSGLLTKKPKVIYVQRNPKAVAVSYYNMTSGLKEVRSYEDHVPVTPYTGSWEDYVEAFLQGEVEYGSWFQYVMEWEQARADNPDLQVFLLNYEDTQKDPVTTIQNMANFLGKPCDVETAASLARLCQPWLPQPDRPKLTLKLTDDGTLTRRGRAGDWKHWFTVAQNERFDSIYRSKMAKSSLLMYYI